MQLKQLISFVSAAALIAISAHTARCAAPQTAADVVRPYLDDQTLLVARLDVQELPWAELQERATAVLTDLVDDPQLPQLVAAGAKQLAAVRESFLQAGGKEIYVVVSLADVPYQPPFFVVTSSAPDKLAQLEAMVTQLSTTASRVLRVRTSKNGILVGSERTLQRIAALEPASRSEFVSAWKAAPDAPLQVVLAPSQDQHRVLEETFPRLPSPWEKLNGKTISQGIQWAVLSVTASPQLQADLVIESRDDAAARDLSALMASSLSKLADLPAVTKVVPDAEGVLALIQPRVGGKQVRVQLTHDARTVDVLVKPLTAALRAARSSAARSQSMNNLKQLALGMHIYHDKHKRFPAAASYDADGKPLLSWRVHLLPYLDQKALYDQFKLDEPWDSEHNRKLAQTIPRTYIDPMQNAEHGMTTYVVPVGEGTIFSGKEGTRIQDIRDGTSNTLMIVSVAADQAVPWTKPDELNVSEADPKMGLFTENRDLFLGALADGSVHVIAESIDGTILWRLFHASDGQPVEWPQ